MRTMGMSFLLVSVSINKIWYVQMCDGFWCQSEEPNLDWVNPHPFFSIIHARSKLLNVIVYNVSLG